MDSPYANASDFVSQTLDRLFRQCPTTTIEYQIHTLFLQLPQYFQQQFLFNMPKTIPMFISKLQYEMDQLPPDSRSFLKWPPPSSNPDLSSTKKRTCRRAPRLCFRCRQPGHEIAECRT